MRIVVPKERARHEHRVGLTPFGVQRLASLGHELLIESGAGEHAHFTDADYDHAGARILFRHEEALGRADLLVGFGGLSVDDAGMIQEGAAVLGFLHLTVASPELIEALSARRVTTIGYEILEDRQGTRPLLVALSEIAGQMAISTAAHLLCHESGGRGLVLGGAPGIAPATVVILGSGTAGVTAARAALAFGAHVVILDNDVEKLRGAIERCGPHLVTSVATPRNLARFTAIADVLIGAVFIPGGRAPFLVDEVMVRGMKRGAVIVDLSIDQGGCVETSRPTTLGNPTFEQFGVLHYCVPNMTANAPRSASRALTNSALPFLQWIAEGGVHGALRADVGLRRGVYLYEGQVVHPHLAQATGRTLRALSELLDPGRRDFDDEGEVV